MKKIIKILFSFPLLSSFFFILTANAAILDSNVRSDMSQHENLFSSSAGFSKSTTIGNLAYYVINAFIGLLGIIFIILMILSGYNWMTAAGDEAKVTKAKDTIRRAIIGLIITVSAYAITYFVFNSLGGAFDAGPSAG